MSQAARTISGKGGRPWQVFRLVCLCHAICGMPVLRKEGEDMTTYEEGRLAYLQDGNLEDNPYLEGTVEATAWEMGFKDCAAEIRVGG